MEVVTAIPVGYELLKWKLTDAMMNERVKCLMPDVPKQEVKDCAINSLNFVGQFDDPDVARFIASQKNKTQIGTARNDFLAYLYHAFSVNEFKRNDMDVLYTIDDDSPEEYEAALKKLIGNGYCTLIDVYYTKRNVGHSLIVGVYKNELVAIDAQQERVMPFTKMIELDRSKDEGYIRTFRLIYRAYSKKRTLVKSMLQRRKSSSNRNTKRRRIGSRSSGRKTRKTRTRTRTRTLHGSRYGSRRTFSRSRSRSRDRRIHSSDIMSE